MKHLKAPNCPFCNPDVAEATFAETKDFRAIYNISPILPGHSLIIPKYHNPSLLELNDEELCEMILFSRDVVQFLLKVFKTTAFNYTIQEGEEAGQSVPHLHLHLIPREDGDLPNPGDWYPELKKSESGVIDSHERERLTPQQMNKIVRHLRQQARELTNFTVPK